jgi:hypothetical protein
LEKHPPERRNITGVLWHVPKGLSEALRGGGAGVAELHRREEQLQLIHEIVPLLFFGQRHFVLPVPLQTCEKKNSLVTCSYDLQNKYPFNFFFLNYTRHGVN